MQWSQIVVAVLGASAVIAVAVISIVYNKNLKLREEQNSDKKQTYLDLIATIDNAKEGNADKDFAKKMKEHSQKVVYYGSTGVLKAFGDYQQFAFNVILKQDQSKPNPEGMLWMKLLGELVYQIRKDLGNLRWRDKLPMRTNSERWFDALRLTIMDIDDYLPKKYKGRRGRKWNDPMVIIKGKELK